MPNFTKENFSKIVAEISPNTWHEIENSEVLDFSLKFLISNRTSEILFSLYLTTLFPTEHPLFSHLAADDKSEWQKFLDVESSYLEYHYRTKTIRCGLRYLLYVPLHRQTNIGVLVATLMSFDTNTLECIAKLEELKNSAFVLTEYYSCLILSSCAATGFRMQMDSTKAVALLKQAVTAAGKLTVPENLILVENLAKFLKVEADVGKEIQAISSRLTQPQEENAALQSAVPQLRMG